MTTGPWITHQAQADRLGVCRGSEAYVGHALLAHVPPLAIYPEPGIWVETARDGYQSRFEVDLLVGVQEAGNAAHWCLVVECDGYDYHGNYAKFKEDRQQDRWFLLAGLPTLRFPGVEAANAADRCVTAIVKAVNLLHQNRLPQDFEIDPESRLTALLEQRQPAIHRKTSEAD